MREGRRADAALPPTSRSEEDDLWGAFARGRSGSDREKLFSIYADFARQIAKRHFLDRRGGDIEFPDLCQLAYAGLLEAIDRFNPTQRVPFKGYAARRISGSILDGLARTSEVRQQVSYRNRIRYERARSLLNAEGTQTSDSLEEALRAFEDLAIGLALGFMLEGTGLLRAAETGDPRANAYESVAWTQSLQHISRAVSSLPEREQMVIRKHYFDDLDFAQIAAILSVGKSRVSQLHRAAIERLKSHLSKSGDFRIER